MKKKPEAADRARRAARSAEVVKEEITKAAQTVQLLRSDLGNAYKATADPLLQIVLLRLMNLSVELQSGVVQVEAALEERK